ncbi:cell division protein FtsZ [Bacillus cereus]|uniref:cell division protein FtsZ n=1 Tax=Bacillus cereus TaxID=1396 RepID=UPI000BFA2059|nr:cell division protein FtsZ [Bacillus cereus]PEQ98488.1 cell division protein FtsZ [Bacillus cereus]
MLTNSNELEFMYGNHDIKNVAIRFGVIGAGQKGNKVADIFAGYKFSDGTPCYPTLAVNLSKTDMVHLQNIDEQDRIHFDGLQGAARTPSIVLETFNPNTNPYAEQQMNKLTEAISRKFIDEQGNLIIDHILLDLGAGGGVGTGFGSLVLQLIKDNFFPVPITMMVSLPDDNPEELNNALLLANEINEFFKIQNNSYDSLETKPLANAILCYNPQMEKMVKAQKGSRDFKNTHMNWQKVSNDYVASLIHEINIIPANFGSNLVSYDASDFQKLFTISGRFLTVGKARIKKQDLNELETAIKKSLDDSYLSCGHKFNTAKTFANILLHPSDADFFQDVETTNRVTKVLSSYKNIKELSGKTGDPIWNSDYAVNYTIFGGMTLPEIIGELSIKAKELNEKMRYQDEEEESVDISFLQNSNTSQFNPFSKVVQNKFGQGTHTSAFARNTPNTQNQTPTEQQPKPTFGSKKVGFGKATPTTINSGAFGNGFGKK